VSHFSPPFEGYFVGKKVNKQSFFELIRHWQSFVIWPLLVNADFSEKMLGGNWGNEKKVEK
jgi:hypothetical protein